MTLSRPRATPDCAEPCCGVCPDMPRVVAPWTWKRALRDHGPDKHRFLLALFVLNTYMDRDGCAFPSQPTWARGARASTRTIQRYVSQAVQLGWLIRSNAGRTGQGWNHNCYQCCVPDGVQLGQKDEELSGTIASQSDDNDGDAYVSPPSPSITRHGDNSIADIATGSACGDDNSQSKVTTPSWRTNSRSENSRSITHAKTEALVRTSALIKRLPISVTAEEIERRRLQAAKIVAAEEAKVRKLSK